MATMQVEEQKLPIKFIEASFQNVTEIDGCHIFYYIKQEAK
jgi:hypothetical protein